MINEKLEDFFYDTRTLFEVRKETGYLHTMNL